MSYNPGWSANLKIMWNKRYSLRSEITVGLTSNTLVRERWHFATQPVIHGGRLIASCLWLNTSTFSGAERKSLEYKDSFGARSSEQLSASSCKLLCTSYLFSPKWRNPLLQENLQRNVSFVLTSGANLGSLWAMNECLAENNVFVRGQGIMGTLSS